MKYFDIFSSSTSISSKYKGSMKYDNKIVRQQEEWRYSVKFSWPQVQAIKSKAGKVFFSFLDALAASISWFEVVSQWVGDSPFSLFLQLAHLRVFQSYFGYDPINFVSI